MGANSRLGAYSNKYSISSIQFFSVAVFYELNLLSFSTFQSIKTAKKKTLFSLETVNADVVFFNFHINSD